MDRKTDSSETSTNASLDSLLSWCEWIKGYSNRVIEWRVVLISDQSLMTTTTLIGPHVFFERIIPWISGSEGRENRCLRKRSREENCSIVERIDRIIVVSLLVVLFILLSIIQIILLYSLSDLLYSLPSSFEFVLFFLSMQELHGLWGSIRGDDVMSMDLGHIFFLSSSLILWEFVKKILRTSSWMSCLWRIIDNNRKDVVCHDPSSFSGSFNTRCKSREGQRRSWSQSDILR